MRVPVQVRAVETTDYAQWQLLWEGYNAFYGRSGDTALADEITRTTWSRFLDQSEPVEALVADAGGRLVGLAHYLFHRSTILVGPTCYLQDLFTVPEARGMGVGQALIEAVCDKARSAGAGRVYWQTHAGNRQARALYDRVAEHAGFIVYRKAL